jgi:hypothetical protein
MDLRGPLRCSKQIANLGLSRGISPVAPYYTCIHLVTLYGQDWLGMYKKRVARH